MDKAEARAFYEIEAIQNSRSARELERQINSLLFERLALPIVSIRVDSSAAVPLTGSVACDIRYNGNLF